MEKAYQFRLTDFVPFTGYTDYLERTSVDLDYPEGLENRENVDKISRREKILMLYTSASIGGLGGLFVGLILNGLEKMAQ